MTLDYFYGQSGELFSYFRIPKALFQDCRFRQLLQCRRNPCFDGDLRRRSCFAPNFLTHCNIHSRINKRSVCSPIGENSGENRP